MGREWKSLHVIVFGRSWYGSWICIDQLRKRSGICDCFYTSPILSLYYPHTYICVSFDNQLMRLFLYLYIFSIPVSVIRDIAEYITQ